MVETALIRLLGRERYIRFYAWLHDLNPMVGLAILMIPLAAIWALVFSLEDHEHDGYTLGDVLFTNSTSSEQNSFMFTAVVELPNGERATVRTRLMAVASQTVDTVCLERRKESDGDVFYRLVGQLKCEATSSQ
jgi:hypothetical protein